MKDPIALDPCSGPCVDVHCVCGMCPPSLYPLPPDVSSYTCLRDPVVYVTPASPSVYLLYLPAQLFIVNTLSFLVAASFHQSPVHPMPFSLCMVVCFHSHACSGQLPGAMQGLLNMQRILNKESSGRYRLEIHFQD